ncbi:UDP-3-O-(3-hydroxymyristoyl)glucosamine N-acyltransferase [Citreimonas salinaria]|uniref:UDP-3-O-acylglucosamine N-acyltransferase n=1 Tax=Citreimonas salinaria TaxID=321339 RepID=A0A1H3IJZ3_9RHOB|nr:UDP-3-O-(3-hydroxymyristoyl)glucosamine N-acyltransferase [Citreimonas salinaria]SDY27705.1 UDP-3-O-[3-hydroxymyristoyl] glucosamine N-acyltransferase [Citreimonas salinaria]
MSSPTPDRHSIAEIAVALGMKAEGDGDLCVVRLAEPALAGADDLALAMKPEFAAGLAEGRARAALMWEGADWRGHGLRAAILAPRPRFALSTVSAMMDPGQGYAPGVHPSAVVDPSAALGDDVSIGPFSVIGPRAQIGAGSVIGPQVHVGADTEIGARALIHAGVQIGARVRIGARFISQPGACIGADGFSFVTPEPSGPELARATLGAEGTATAQGWARIHSLGGVAIGDDVEVGAKTCIDRGTVRDTVIGDGVKIDNLVQVGHNVVIGRDCMLCAQVGIAGSTVLGEGVVMGGKAGASDNIHIGDRAILAGATIALANVPAGRVMLGYPAMKMDSHVESYKALRRLPRLFRDVAALKKAVSNTPQSD